MTSVYISGPINGMPDQNRAAFKQAADDLVTKGFEPVNPHDLAPHEHDGPCPESYAHVGEHSAACYLRSDFAALLDCDFAALLDCESSTGAGWEIDLAERAGIPVHFDIEELP